MKGGDSDRHARFILQNRLTFLPQSVLYLRHFRQDPRTPSESGTARLRSGQYERLDGGDDFSIGHPSVEREGGFHVRSD
jgi:hypothetical protein